MKNFDQWMIDRQAEWRRTHMASQECGKYRGRPYAHILPKDLWEEGLWSGIGPESENSLPGYLRRTGVQKHEYAHHLNSSWMLCANLYFPFGGSAHGKALLASFLKRRVAVEIDSLEEIELEYEDSDGMLRPSLLLGEKGTRGAHQTSPDLGLLVNRCRGLVLVESKLTEDSFYKCSAWKHKGSRRLPGNHEPNRCKNPLAVAKYYASQCHQHHPAWGRMYWQHLAPVVDEEALAGLPHCPAMKDGFQLLRQQALAEGIAQSGRYDLVVSAVAVDERNDDAEAALKRSGIAGLRQWGQLFRGRARFAVFTHQEWVGWVQEHDTGAWSDWLSYVRARYCLQG